MNKTASQFNQPDLWTVGFASKRGKPKIRYGIFRPYKNTSCKRLIILLNGRTEYIEKYQYVAEDLDLAKDWGFLTLDHIGQGKSQGQPGYIRHIREYVQGVNQVLDQIAPEVQYHIVAHSMGGLIALWGTLFNYFSPKSLHLLSPLIGIYNPLLSDSVFKLVSQVACVFGYDRQTVIGHNPRPVPFSQNPLTTNEDRYKKIARSPHGFFPITYGWLQAIQNAITDIHTKGVVQNLSCETYVTVSSQDQLVDSEKALEWAKFAKGMGLAVDGGMIEGKHELLSECDDSYQETLDRIKELINTTEND